MEKNERAIVVDTQRAGSYIMGTIYFLEGGFGLAIIRAAHLRRGIVVK